MPALLDELTAEETRALIRAAKADALPPGPYRLPAPTNEEGKPLGKGAQVHGTADDGRAMIAAYVLTVAQIYREVKGYPGHKDRRYLLERTPVLLAAIHRQAIGLGWRPVVDVRELPRAA